MAEKKNNTALIVIIGACAAWYAWSNRPEPKPKVYNAVAATQEEKRELDKRWAELNKRMAELESTFSTHSHRARSPGITRK